MNKAKLLLIALMLTGPALADGYEFEAGYALVGGDESDVSIDLGAIYGMGGYRWDHASNYSSTAEVLLAIGVQLATPRTLVILMILV